ncbi:restriction endonuclease subunit S [Pseudomonas aeruginosa]|uniref:restriction endonuclease subunit S n=1 Tax=Pseudomonas aeruginosa TaxID=287 RepID=UPI000CF5812B|nr:restriction endonuclease subunit S [Pseudomonas aeruginosa]HBP4598777.1 restriction endonuclease subunit S [Pseudomonas aeruginosa]
MSELPSSWITCTLGEIVDYGVTETVEPEEIPDNAWVLELEDLERDTSKILKKLTFGERKSKSTKNRFKSGDVLYSRLRPYLNKVARVSEPGYCTTEIIPISPPPGVDRDYLFYWLKSHEFIEYATSVSHGLNMPRLGKEAGKAAPFLLPPLPEQLSIARKLNSIFEKVESCRDRLNNIPNILKAFRKEVLRAAVDGELTEAWRAKEKVSSEWEAVSLGDSVESLSYGTSAKSEKTGDVPVLRMGNIQDGSLNWDDLVFTSDKEEISKYKLEPGDLLFNRTNSPELVGKTAVYFGEREAIYAGYLIKVKCKDNLNPEFLNFCLESPYGRDYCWRVKSDGVSQSNINASKLSKFTFSLPSIEEQLEIVRRVKSLFQYSADFEKKFNQTVETLERLTSSALTKAFSGQLSERDHSGESAESILLRLKNRIPVVQTRKKKRVQSKNLDGEKIMLTRNEVAKNHLSAILQDKGHLTAEELWSASRLEIDDFYDQLKEEVSLGLLRESVDGVEGQSRVLEPVS